MCFKKVFLSSCGCGRRIAVKWTTRTACGHGGQFLLRRAMSRLSSKYLSLLFEIFLNNAEQNLNSGQLHHLPTSNGAEITSLLFAVIHLSQGILNPFRGIYIQPFRGIFQPFRGIIQPFRGIFQPFRGIIQLFRGIILPFGGSTYPFRRMTCASVTCCQRTTQSVPPRLHESSCYGELTFLELKPKNLVNEIMTMRNTSTEAMPGQYRNSIFSTNSRSERQSFHCLHLRKGRCKRKATPCRKRDREPSRLPYRVLKLVKRRKVRGRIKHFLKKSVPVSSVLFNVATSSKLWIVKLALKEESFFTRFFLRKFEQQKCWTSGRNYTCYPKFLSELLDNKNYYLSEKKLLLSGDIELNPGPAETPILLNTRLLRLGLIPLDVGGSGDCFFRSVSHQLYGNCSHHLDIRTAGVEYLRANPERFIESFIGSSWLQYLSSMSMAQTWADNIIIQAVADSMNLNIHIIESSENFAEITVIRGASSLSHERSIYVGHIGELHYVSTLPAGQQRIENQMAHDSSHVNISAHYSESDAGKNHNAFMKEYGFKRKLDKEDQQNNTSEHKTKKRQGYMKQYMKRYRAERVSDATKELHNSYKKNYRAVKKLQNCDIEFHIAKFHEAVSKGPFYICSCCDQLWYKHSVVHAETFKKGKPEIGKHLVGKVSVDGIEWLCNSCKKFLSKNKIPACAVVNGMIFPQKPSFFDLNELECRLLAPRIAFQKLMQAPRGKQLKIHGNIVNVPADVSHTVSILPRLPSQTGTIKVNLKRRLQYKSSVLSLNIRPSKVNEAAMWLVKNSDLYKEEGVVLNEDWISKYNEELLSLSQDENDSAGQPEMSDSHIENKADSLHLSEDQWSEDEAETIAGVTDTMLTPPDFLESDERQSILNVAPAEGSRPLSLFRDKYCEELAYPGIFLGQKRQDNKDRSVKVHYSEICKSELRRSDRRAAMNVENIFFKAKKLQMKILLGKANVALRKCKSRKNDSLRAGNLKQEGALERLIHHDEGFKFLRALRGSPPYFEKAKKDLFAMIRQLGPATLFCSFSSAETQWTHLLRILGHLVDQKEYSDGEIDNLNWDEKCRLIQMDPVTCARHFDYQISQFIGQFLLGGAEPLGKLSDWFYRVEYQQRGSPHIHMLIWLENSPTFGEDSDEEVTSFIDKIITCKKPGSDADLLKLVNRQIHRHSHTCRKKLRNECRFNYPQPPMKETAILYPLDRDIAQSQRKLYEDTWKNIKQRLNDEKEGQDITFNELLSNLNITEDIYICAIQSSLNAPTVFLKRNPNELRINNYNPACLKAWRANMDIQFVLDVYACAVYIPNYISKSQRGMSDLLRQACVEARKQNSSIKQQVRDIGSKFLNNVEISAQEAVYIILQLPMRKASRQIVFINTSPKDERVEILKPVSDIKELDDDSEDIFTSGLLKRYAKRPASLENLTLADWAAWYDSSGTYVRQSNELDTDNLLLESSAGDINDDHIEGFVESTSGKIKKRSKAKIIRSVWFNKETEPEKHYRELIMLFTSWRNEETDLIGNSSCYREQYFILANSISEQMKHYAVCNEDLDEIQEQINSMENTEENDQYDLIAPGTQDVEYQDNAEGNRDLQPDFNDYNLSDDIGIPSADMNHNPLILNELQDDDYRQMVQMLNKQQKEFFYHALHLIKTSDDPCGI